jgi:predicted DNA-binding transcriptional regulator AlpA
MSNRFRAVAWPSPLVTNWQRERLAAADQHACIVPDEPFRFLRLPEVRAKVGLSTSTIYRLMAAGQFPRPIPIDRASSGAPAGQSIAAG